MNKHLINHNNLTSIDEENLVSDEEKVRLVLEGLRGKKTIEEICRNANVNPELYYKWVNKFIESGSEFVTKDTDVITLKQIYKLLLDQNKLLEIIRYEIAKPEEKK